MLKGNPDTWRLVKAHGKAVGLPTDDDMGNSEVGHNALGAGRIFAQGYAHLLSLLTLFQYFLCQLNLFSAVGKL